ncbi:MAG: PAS-domain containing protein [Alphaproteobacteria bacterium]|nr:PAS-domain containing protein [Alphaproteobacteria bacterium]
MDLSSDIAYLLPFGVTLGAIALAGSLAFVVLAMRVRSDDLLRRAVKQTARAEARFQKEAAIVNGDPGALFVWRNIDGEPEPRAGAANVLTGCIESDTHGDLQDALKSLGGEGSLFSMTVPGPDGRVFQAYGKPAAGQAALWLRDVTPDAEASYNLTVRLTASEIERARLGDLLDVAPMPVWRRGQNLDLVWVNRAYTAAADPAIGQDVISDQIELDRDSRALAERALETNVPQSELRYVIVGGHRRAFDIHAVPMGDGVASFAIDVTDVDETKRLLQQHIDAHEETLHRLPAAVAIFGRDQRLKFSNKAYAKLWDIDERWLATHPSDGDILERLRETRRLPEQRDFTAWKKERLALYTNVIEEREEHWHLPRGSTLRVTCQAHPFGGLIFIYADVTDQMALERSLNQLSSVQRTTIDHLTEALAVFGTDGRLKLFNKAFAEHWRIDPKALADQPRFADVFALCRRTLPDEGHWSMLTMLITGAATERRVTVDRLQRTDDLVLSFAAAPLPDGSLLLSYRDVTDTAMREKALEERNAALLASDKLKSDFISNVSYQLRTPLNSIMGFADMMSEGIAGKVSDKQKSYLADILNASKTLETLINDILDLALIEAGTIELDRKDVDVAEVLMGVRPLVEERARKARVEVSCECDAATGILFADQKRLLQVVYNLVINAIEHTPPNGKIVYGAEGAAGEVRIFVNDTGVGIPPEYQPVAFERFESTTRAKEARRAGLGLALVRSFVELHGGWVELDSTVGKGTRIACHFPRHAVEAPAGALASKDTPRKSAKKDAKTG